MDTDDFVRVEIAQPIGEMMLEVCFEVSPRKLVAHARGSHVTWHADDVRITVTASAIKLIQ